MIPPTIRIGAETTTVRAMKTSCWTCWTSFVLRVISDAGPKWLTSTWPNVSTVLKTALRTSRAKPIRDERAEVDAGDRGEADDHRDQEHEGADPKDVVGVALDDAVVDDVAVEVRQVQVADRADEQQHQHDAELRRVRP